MCHEGPLLFAIIYLRQTNVMARKGRHMTADHSHKSGRSHSGKLLYLLNGNSGGERFRQYFVEMVG